VLPREGDRHPAAHREPHDRDPGEPEGVGERREVAGHRGDRVVTVGRRVRIAMAPLVEGQNAIARSEGTRLLVPGARVAGDAVEHDEGGRRRLAPFRVVKPLALQDDRSIPMHIEF